MFTIQKNTVETEDFEVSIASRLDEDTDLVTGFDIESRIRELSESKLLAALNEYNPADKRYSAFLSEAPSDTSGLTLTRLDELARNPQSDIKAILEINSIIRKYLNDNVLIGRTYESIVSNTNTDIRLSYSRKSVEGHKQKTNKLQKAEACIDAFNEQINLNKLVRTTVPLTYAEGNRILYLKTDGDGYSVIELPLGVAIVSDYLINGEPVLLVDIKELTNRLKKTQLKDKKGKPLFFKDVEDEIKNNYPPEILKAYKDKENYAVLDNNRAKIMRIGDLGRKYGLSPIFRSLRPTLMLDSFATADNITAKAIAKKIIFQKMRKEILGQNLDRKGFEDQSFAHQNAVKAFSQSTVLLTAPASVESLEYIEPKVEMISKDTVEMYRNQVMITLGINFWDNQNRSVSSAKLSISQLLLLINSISSQLETIVNEWYKLVLDEQGIGAEYAPKITILDSEMLEMGLKIDLAKLIYSTFNLPRETALSLLGFSLEDEIVKRQKENEMGLDEIFIPYGTSFTKSPDDDKGGRPKSNDPEEKNEYDENYNKDGRT